MDAYGHCEALVRTANRDRYLAGLFAPAKPRRHLYALYAFAAEIGRVGEIAREPLAGEIRLQWWRDTLGGQASEGAGNPVAAALLDTIAQFALPCDPLFRLIDAQAFDLYDDAMANLAALDAYAEATAGTVFRLGAEILASEVGHRDVPHSPVGDAARHAGIAYGIAHQIAAFRRDAARRKVFVPADILAGHGVPRAAIEARQDSAGLRSALGELRHHAEGAFAAFAAAALTLPGTAAPAFLPAALVPLMLARRKGDSFTAAEVAPWRRQWTLWRAARRWPKV
jgi:15-cis-phytoene synthase